MQEPMKELRNWSAKRSGKAMTVTGVDPHTGREVKVTDVHTIGVSTHPEAVQPGTGLPCPVAVAGGGEMYRLAF